MKNVNIVYENHLKHIINKMKTYSTANSTSVLRPNVISFPRKNSRSVFLKKALNKSYRLEEAFYQLNFSFDQFQLICRFEVLFL